MGEGLHGRALMQSGSLQIYSAVYSGIDVYEMEVNRIAVMRRRNDSWLNATQILKVAGIEKPKRTRILEKDIFIGEHEKVQGGYGKYQGTWIKFERGLEFCGQYGVEELLRPLLSYDMGQDGAIAGRGGIDTPTKEQAMAARQKRLYAAGAENRTSGQPGTFENISSTASRPVAAISKVRVDSPAPPIHNGTSAHPASLGRESSQQHTDSQDSAFPGGPGESIHSFAIESSFSMKELDSAYATRSRPQYSHMGSNLEPQRKRMRPSPSVTGSQQPANEASLQKTQGKQTRSTGIREVGSLGVGRSSQHTAYSVPLPHKIDHQNRSRTPDVEARDPHINDAVAFLDGGGVGQSPNSVSTMSKGPAQEREVQPGDQVSIGLSPVLTSTNHHQNQSHEAEEGDWPAASHSTNIRVDDRVCEVVADAASDSGDWLESSLRATALLGDRVALTGPTPRPATTTHVQAQTHGAGEASNEDEATHFSIIPESETGCRITAEVALDSVRRSQSAITSIQLSIAHFQEPLSALQQELKHIQQELVQRRSENEALRRDKAGLFARIGTLEAEQNAISARNQFLERQNGDVEARQIQFSLQNQELSSENERLKAKSGKLDRKLRSIRRLTAEIPQIDGTNNLATEDESDVNLAD
ncbi:hypothetical protein B0O99DRAFT_677698 [Bisporella sp. PMI_857]|nr:hypothetical protein B0O99DRAFT_677698 [Bisporella sp. PMI_857]